jgi:hypothetical protein
MKTCVSGLNALFQGTKVEKHPFYSIRPKMMFGSVMEHFANLVHVKRWNLVFRSWMHYFAAPKFRSIDSTPFDQKWYMGALRSTSLTLYENLCFGPECTIAGYQSCEASILLHWTQNDVWECYGAFRWPSARKRWYLRRVKDENLCLGPECTISGHQSCEASILLHWTQNDVWECYGAFR